MCVNQVQTSVSILRAAAVLDKLVMIQKYTPISQLVLIPKKRAVSAMWTQLKGLPHNTEQKAPSSLWIQISLCCSNSSPLVPPLKVSPVCHS